MELPFVLLVSGNLEEPFAVSKNFHVPAIQDVNRQISSYCQTFNHNIAEATMHETTFKEDLNCA
jgi:hypothetical protein